MENVVNNVATSIYSAKWHYSQNKLHLQRGPRTSSPTHTPALCRRRSHTILLSCWRTHKLEAPDTTRPVGEPGLLTSSVSSPKAPPGASLTTGSNYSPGKSTEPSHPHPALTIPGTRPTHLVQPKHLEDTGKGYKN